MNVLGAAFWEGEGKPSAALLPARMRGRASLLTALFANVVERAAASAGVDAGTLPWIFGSAYGEMGTTLALLEQLHGGDGQLSPAKFQASVHNTATGQLSIALGNPRFSSSLAAGPDTVAMCLLEARAWLAGHGGGVIVAWADEGVSPVLQPGREYSPLAAACVLSLDGEPALATLGPLVAGASPSNLDMSGVVGNPCAAGLEIVRAVFSGGVSILDLNAGAPGGYSVTVHSLTGVSS